MLKVCNDRYKNDFSIFKLVKLREIFHSVLNYVVNETEDDKEIKTVLKLIVNFAKSAIEKEKIKFMQNIEEETDQEIKKLMMNEFFNSARDLQKMISFMFIDYSCNISENKVCLLKTLFFDELFSLFVSLSNITSVEKQKHEKHVEYVSVVC